MRAATVAALAALASAACEESRWRAPKVAGWGRGNPSKLRKPRRVSANCSHDLFRNPKTGSTALYNALQTDAALAAHVCWRFPRARNAEWHQTPGAWDRPVVVALREPADHWASFAAYQLRRNATAVRALVRGGRLDLNAVADGLRAARAAPRVTPHDQHAFIPTGDRAGMDDLVLCVGGAAAPLEDQLRSHFRDDAICPVPRENSHPSDLPADRAPLSAENAAWLEAGLKDTYAAWRRFC